MYLDVHGHLAPYGERGGGPPSLRDPEGMLAAKRERGIRMTVIGSPAGPGSMLPWEAADNYRQPLDRVRAHNEAMADLVDRYPHSLRAYAYLDPLGGPAMLDQARELIKQWHFVGLLVNTSIDGQLIAGEAAEDFFAMAAELRAPVLLHPPSVPLGASAAASLGFVEHVARPCDVTLSVAAIVCAGWLTRYPELRLIAAAGGGGIAGLREKLDLAVAPRPGQPERTGPAPAELPSSALRRLIVEMSCPSLAQLRANIEVLGSENILFGTDAPPLMDEVSRLTGLIEQCGLDDAALQRIAWRNAAALFGIDIAP
jgi:predicted TIM-barrel fold metal-dependent hydrolase